MSSREKTNSLVFFDLESTGLFGQGPPPRITGLAFLAISRAQLSQTLESGELPHPVPGLCFRVNPGEDTFWNEQSILMTGLDEDVVVEEKSLGEQWGVVRSFLDSRLQPLTLIAHNGDRFDFKLLEAEMARLDLPSLNCFRVDSIPVLRELDRRQGKQLSQATAQENKAKTLKAPLEYLDAAKKPRLQITPTTDQTTSAYRPPPIKKRTKKKSFSLKAAYERATGKWEFPGEHQALGDCRALLKVAIRSGTQFLDIVDEYKKRF